MGVVRETMIAEMRLRGYSARTIKAYTHYAYQYAKYYNKSPLTTTRDELKSFLRALVNEGKSLFTIHMYCAALKFLFTTNEKYELAYAIPRIRVPQRLPEVLNVTEVETILNQFDSLRMKLLFTLVYSAGLRISEVANLRLEHIDLIRNTIHIHSAKGNKDRLTILSQKAKRLLLRYVSKYCIQSYLFFPRKSPQKPLRTRYIQYVFERAYKATNIPKRAHVHTLRHSFATHLLDNNTNIFYIMKLLGHSSIQSTIVYLHMQNPDSLHIRSPYDIYDFNLLPTNDEAQAEFDFSLAS
jgi:integrase/recombinase XerD